jgi:pimeloyl-ACP methyl ester carboxylesterase
MELFYRKYGEGPPLIILHGLYGSSDNWVSVAKKISNKFTVYLPDLRNHGNSPHSDIHDYEALSDDIIEFAEARQLTRFFLAGHSMGGKTAVSVAIRKPELLMGLIVADISPFDDHEAAESAVREHLQILKAMAATNLAGIKKREEADSQLNTLISSVEIRNLIMKNLQRNSDSSFSWKINVDSLIRNIGNITGGYKKDKFQYGQISGFPVIFLKGENSGYITNEGFYDILRIFPGAELKVIKNAGHWLHADNPEAVTESFLRLLE